MHINNDFFKNVLKLWGCDEGKEETQLKAENLTRQLLKYCDSLGMNILYDRYGDEYKEHSTIPQALWLFRLVDNGIMPELDKRFPTLEDVYKLMKDEGYTESEINTYKNLPSSFVEQTKKKMQTVVLEGTADYSVGTTNFISWFGDRTIPAPLDAVTFWNDYTVTNTWKLTHNDSEEDGDIYEDKTEEEIKEIVSVIAKDFFGDVLESTNTIPVDFDEKGGMIFNKTSLSDGDDEDTYMVTDGYGDEHIVDGKEKATEKATELVNEKIQIQFGIRIERKITEPDGYFAWREENRAEYL